MHWQEVCEHPSLKDLPFKIELDETGKIIMSPRKVYHSLFQGKLAALLYKFLDNGESLVACTIHTQKGTKVADVAWAFAERFNIIRNEVECSIAPQICIEVLSDSNTQKEMREKRQLYFDNDAIEVWLCNQQGELSFYNAEGKLKNSIFSPSFPDKI